MIENFKKNTFLIASMLMMPVLTFAQFDGNDDIGTFIAKIIYFINKTLVPFVFAVALLLFVYGVYLFFFYGRSEEEARKKGRDYMMWAVIAFVVMVSVWGIVNLLADGFGLNERNIDSLIPEAVEVPVRR